MIRLLATGIVAIGATAAPVYAEDYGWSNSTHACLTTDSNVIIHAQSATDESQFGQWGQAPKTVFLKTGSPREGTNAIFPETITTSSLSEREETYIQDNIIYYKDGYEYATYHEMSGKSLILDSEGELFSSAFSRTSEYPQQKAWFTLTADCSKL